MLTLGDLHIGQDAIIRVVGGEGELRHHLLDMGRSATNVLGHSVAAAVVAKWERQIAAPAEAPIDPNDPTPQAA